MSLNIEQYMAWSNFIDLNHVELNCDLFMISLDKCNGICNAIDDLTTKICVSSKTKDVNKRFKNI